VPGIDAIRFYSDFADQTKKVYSWNSDMDNSLALFMQGRLAVMYGYSYMLPIIKAQAPKLNFGIKKLPQVSDSNRNVNIADYYVEVVSKKSANRAEAWDFVQFETTDIANVKSYLEKTNKVSAIRSIISEQSNDNDLGVFADQMFTAKTWYHGMNYSEAVKSFSEMLDAINKKPENFDQEVKIFEGRLKQTL
jgi:ABC-type glycerol-3-phosphate transport system substrate-binding protein